MPGGGSFHSELEQPTISSLPPSSSSLPSSSNTTLSSTSTNANILCSRRCEPRKRAYMHNASLPVRSTFPVDEPSVNSSTAPSNSSGDGHYFLSNLSAVANGAGGGGGGGAEDSFSNFSDSAPLYELKNPAIGVVLACFSLVVVVGNIMVIVAVFKEIYLRTVTNYFIVSLAIADVLVGGVVMPFSISNEMTNSVWLYGQAWCDLWRSLDVLASTASILNLCVISLDRYWAITDPIAYPSKMSNYKVCILITLVWFCSAGISFPAIAWWKAVTPPDLPDNHCLFTEDSAYLIISSVVSFYIPTFIMMFVYCKIYRAALAQTAGIKSGSKVTSDCPRGDNGEVMTLRIHRGGLRLQDDQTSSTPNMEHRSSESDGESPLSSVRHHVYHNNHHHHHHQQHTPRSTTFITKKIRHFAISKKITKLAREQKAAKTLGIVVGVFITCWVPFFCANVLFGICHSDCVHKPKILFPIFTWLGYINSGMNPIIYALSMRDFRRAFSKMIFCCPRYRHGYNMRHTYGQTNSLSASSFSVSCGDRCVSMRI